MRPLTRPSLATLARGLLAGLLVLGVLGNPLAETREPLQWRWSGVRELVAIGDVHGAHDSLVSILRSSGLVDASLSWQGGAAHLVLLGDLVDRGPRSRDVLDLVMRLQREAPASGGRVHVVLGNHEAMVLTGDLRYVHPNDFSDFAAEESDDERQAALLRVANPQARTKEERAAARVRFDRRFPPGYYANRRAFAPDGVYGRWLLEQRILVVINGMVFVHGGLPLSLLRYDPDELNETVLGELREFLEIQQRLFRSEILTPEMGIAEQAAAVEEALRQRDAKELSSAQRARVRADLRRLSELLKAAFFDPQGPLWYRGTSLNPGVQESQSLARVLSWLDADAAVVGHTPSHTGRIETRIDGRVIRVDTGMLTSYYNGRPSALILEGGRLATLYPGEGVRPLPGSADDSEPEIFSARARLEEFLQEAEVVHREEVGAGVTGAERITLTRGGERHRAIFKDVDAQVKRRRSPSGVAKPAFADRYANEIAAYRLDRLLDLGLVPPTVQRKVSGRRGSLQLWVENAISEANRRVEDLAPKDPAAFDRAMRRMDVFDALIQNIDRDPSNILITTTDGRVHLIDHSRAFGKSLSRPARLADVRLLIDPELAEALEKLDARALRRELGQWLDNDRIKALLARRDQVLRDALLLEASP